MNLRHFKMIAFVTLALIYTTGVVIAAHASTDAAGLFALVGGAVIGGIALGIAVIEDGS